MGMRTAKSGRSDEAHIASESLMPAPMHAARNLFFVCETPQAVRNPPWLHPPMPSRCGSAIPRATAASTMSSQSVQSTVPTPPCIVSANAEPRPLPAHTHSRETEK